ncbi:protein indeterminate-domain 7-like [Daucus carota subsp. sativus]|uniref:protein indeterminate-domain 7-like n=1 Tax=Daucus carota subsp. sativus TaxID=79200 RepID=UPI0007F03A39|nr:PREDICTED: protein indeterminate-domain 7-like [Daucus carota subsp. sativus]
MAASSASMLENQQSVDVASFGSADAASPRRNRNRPGHPNPDAEVVALSPESLTAKNRFVCELCDKGFRRKQNLQLHRRGHNLPWKLNKNTNQEVQKKVYVCPENGCPHHDPSKAPGDLTGIKKHFARKHGEKQFCRCSRCHKRYAVLCDLKAHSKICRTKEYKCECGFTFSRRDNFITHRSFCDVLAQELARHTINPSPLSTAASSVLANAANPAPVSQGSAEGLLFQANHQQFASLVPVGSAFQPLPPNFPVGPFPGTKLGFPIASDSSGIHGIPAYPAPTNMFSAGFNGGANMITAPNDMDLNIHNSFSGMLMNVETSAYNVLNSPPFPQAPAPAYLHKGALTAADPNSVGMMKSMGGFSGAMKFGNYEGGIGAGMHGGWAGGSNSFQDMYNVGGAYLSDQVNAPYGGMMMTDGMFVGESSKSAVVQPQMSTVQTDEYCDKHTRDFLGMGNVMDSLPGTGMEIDGFGYGTGTVTNSPDSEATISAEAGPFVPRHPAF